MNIAEKVRKHIEGCKEREPILIEDIKVENKYINARNIAINRLQKNGLVRKYKNGVYYKPFTTRFGELGIDEDMLIQKKYIKKDNKINGYVTGPTLWNNWGLTTQLPKRKWIVSNEVTRNTEKNDFKIKLLAPKVKVTNDNYKLLQYLDIIEQLNYIQDVDNEKLFKTLMEHLEKFDMEQITYLIDYTKYYKKLVINLTGALVEYKYANSEQYLEIKHFLNIRKNEVTSGKKIKIIIDESLLKNKKNWGLY